MILYKNNILISVKTFFHSQITPNSAVLTTVHVVKFCQGKKKNSKAIYKGKVYLGLPSDIEIVNRFSIKERVSFNTSKMFIS